MKCSIERVNKTGEIRAVYAPNGALSIAYKTLLDNQKDQELAAQSYLYLQSTEFKEWFSHVPGSVFDVNGDPFVQKGTDGLYVERGDGARKVLDGTAYNYTDDIISRLHENIVEERQDSSGYVLPNGHVVTRRGTDAVKEFYEQIFRNPQKDFDTVEYADMGTIVHAYQEVFVNSLLAKEKLTKAEVVQRVSDMLSTKKDKDGNNIYDKYLEEFPDVFTLPDDQFNMLAEVINGMMQDIYSKAAKRGGIREIFTEKTIYDPDTDTATTIDMLVIHGDGSAAIYDYKTMFNAYKYNKTAGEWVRDKQVADYKHQGYSIQLKNQMDTLRKHYGIDRFRETRIIPIHANLTYDKESKKVKPSFSFMHAGYSSGQQDIATKPIPVAGELTGDVNNDKILNSFRDRQEQLRVQLNKLRGADEATKKKIRDEIMSLHEAQQQILIDSNLDSLYVQIQNTIDNLNKIVKTSGDITKEVSGQIRDGLTMLEFYENIAKLNTSPTSDSEVENIKRDMITNIYNLRQDILQFSIDKLSDKYSVDLNRMMAEADYSHQFVTLDRMEGGVFKVLSKIVDDSRALTRGKTQELADWAIDFKTRAGSDEALRNIYNILLNKNTLNMHSKFKQEYYDTIADMIQAGNAKFFTENFDIKEGWFEYYEAKKKAFMNTLLVNGKIDADGNPKNEYVRQDIDLFDSNNNLELFEAAYLNPKNQHWLAPKDPSAWYSSEFATINANPLAKELYEKYNEINSTFYAFGIQNSLNFIPSIKKNVAERVADGDWGSIPTALLSDLSNNSVTRDSNIGSFEQTGSVPIFFQSPVFSANNKQRLTELENKTNKTSEEQLEYDRLKNYESNSLSVEDKSTDLLSNLIIYGRMGYNYKHMTDVDDFTYMLKYIAENQDQYLTNTQGYVKRDSYGELESGKGNSKNLENLNAFVNFYIYNEKIQGKDYNIEVAGKTYSASRVALDMKKYLSAKALGLNMLSAAGNGIGAYLNSYINGVAGQYYNNKQRRNAMKMLATQGKLAGALTEYFGILSEDWEYDQARNVTKNGVSDNFRYDNFYVLHKIAEGPISSTILLATLSNLAIDSDGNLRKLDSMPEGTKSILDRSTVDEKGRLTIDGLMDNPQLFTKIRKYVLHADHAIRGATSSDDIIVANTHIFGQLLSQFRGWIVPTFTARFKQGQMNPYIREFEIGRYRSAATDMAAIVISDMAGEKLNTIMKIIADVTLGTVTDRFQFGQNDLRTIYENMHEEYKAKRSHLDPSELANIDEFIEGKRKQFRAAVAELRVMLLLLASLSLLGGDWDDDGEPDYKNWWATKAGYAVLRRGYQELSFYINPYSFDEFVKKPVPITSLANSLFDFVGNTYDETRDVLFGENYSRDASGLFYHTINALPGGRTMMNLREEIIGGEGTSSYPEEGSKEFQFYNRIYDDN